MKLRTSYCNGTVIKKNVTRFAPAWVLYTVFWLLLILMMLDADGSGVHFASDMAYSLSIVPILNFCYALLCGQILFGDLYNSRLCYALHALPLRREGWFITNVLCGILFSLVPNLIITLISTLFMGEAWAVAPLWLLCMTLQYLFFFGVAVLSAYCVGNRFAMALVYGIINVISLILYWLAESLYAPMLYGIRFDTDFFQIFSPVYCMCAMGDYVNVEYTKVGGSIVDGPYVQVLDGWWYLAVCAAVGLVFMGIGLLLYRRRNLESAGDFVAVKALEPVFMLLYCLCGGAAGYLFFSLFVGDESLFFLIVGMTVGWFTGRMLLERTIRVFRWKSLVGCGAFLLAFLLTLGLTRLDILGVTRWIPQADQIESVGIATDSVYYYNASDYAMTDTQEIEDMLTLHRYGIENRDADYNGKADVYLTICYRMKDGRTVSRYYTVDVDTQAGEILEGYMSRKEYVLGPEATDAAAFAAQVAQIEAEGHLIYGEDKQLLIQAIMLDCQAGTMAQDWSYHQDEQTVTWLTFQMIDGGEYGSYYYRDIRVYPSNINIMAWLEDNGIWSAKYEESD